LWQSEVPIFKELFLKHCCGPGCLFRNNKKEEGEKTAVPFSVAINFKNLNYYILKLKKKIGAAGSL
jgi:hypothetical protein